MSRSPAAARVAAWLAALALLAASAVYIAATFEWRAALSILARAHAGWFFAGGAIAIVVYWVLRALRWRLLLAGMGTHAPLVDVYLSSCVALSLSVFTPLQSGEALKVELLRRQGHVDRLPGYTAFAVERVADLYVIAAMGIVSMAAASRFPLAAACAVLIALPVAAFALLRRARVPGRAGALLARVREGVSDAPALLWLFVLTSAAWLAVAFGWYATMRSVGIDLDLPQTLGLLSIVSLATIASLIPGGLGIAEAGTAEVLRRFGVDATLAQAGALALRGFSLLVIALGLLHLVLLRVRTASSPT